MSRKFQFLLKIQVALEMYQVSLAERSLRKVLKYKRDPTCVLRANYLSDLFCDPEDPLDRMRGMQHDPYFLSSPDATRGIRDQNPEKYISLFLPTFRQKTSCS